MAVQPKPLRFLFRKYAGQVPGQGKLSGSLDSPPSKSESRRETSSLNNLHLLGREFSKLERIQMFFAMSEEPCECPSLVNSSVGSASTHGRSCYSQKETRRVSPSRYRSRSQEFQSKYKLAVARYSPEYLKHVSQTASGNSQVTHLPKLNIQRAHTHEQIEQGNMKNDDLRNIVQIPTEERKLTNGHSVKPDDVVTLQIPEQGVSTGARNQTSFTGASSKYKKRTDANAFMRVAAGQLPRCLSGSTVDIDRLDSSYYQYLLDDLSSLSSSPSYKSVHSDFASPVSARAQRPSTSGTVGTTQRLRDLTTGGTDISTTTGYRQSARNMKTPDIQWPPRYAIIPSWPSYEDIQTLNSCGEHRDIMTRLYRKELEGKTGRRSRDRSQRVNFWANSQNRKIHVVPSHTNMKCAMCNLYRHTNDASVLCPPNTPLITSHDCQEETSRLSTNYSLRVNPSSNRNTSIASGKSSKRGLRSTGEYNLKKVGDIGSVTSAKSSNIQVEPFSTSNPKQNPRNQSKGVSYSWNTCKLAYVKAHA